MAPRVHSVQELVLRRLPRARVPAMVLCGLNAVFHFLFFILETFLFMQLGESVFRRPEAIVRLNYDSLKNTGAYNAFIGAGMAWALHRIRTQDEYQHAVFFGVCVWLAGLIGGISVSRTPVIIQCGPALLLLACCWLLDTSIKLPMPSLTDAPPSLAVSTRSPGQKQTVKRRASSVHAHASGRGRTSRRSSSAMLRHDDVETLEPVREHRSIVSPPAMLSPADAAAGERARMQKGAPCCFLSFNWRLVLLAVMSMFTVFLGMYLNGDWREFSDCELGLVRVTFPTEAESMMKCEENPYE